MLASAAASSDTVTLSDLFHSPGALAPLSHMAAHAILEDADSSARLLSRPLHDRCGLYAAAFSPCTAAAGQASPEEVCRDVLIHLGIQGGERRHLEAVASAVRLAVDSEGDSPWPAVDGGHSLAVDFLSEPIIAARAPYRCDPASLLALEDELRRQLRFLF